MEEALEVTDERAKDSQKTAEMDIKPVFGYYDLRHMLVVGKGSVSEKGF